MRNKVKNMFTIVLFLSVQACAAQSLYDVAYEGDHRDSSYGVVSDETIENEELYFQRAQ